MWSLNGSLAEACCIQMQAPTWNNNLIPPSNNTPSLNNVSNPTDIWNSIPRRGYPETHSLTVSQRTLTGCKEDWGLILLGSQKADNLEETIKTYFIRGLTIQKIHQALRTSHNYTQSLQSLEKKLNKMNISRRTNEIDSSQKVDVEKVVSYELISADQVWNFGPQVSILPIFFVDLESLLKHPWLFLTFQPASMTVALINKILDPSIQDAGPILYVLLCWIYPLFFYFPFVFSYATHLSHTCYQSL
ncbi:hypothetical protein VP01_3278g1 [Puccinia sorghi]|uniref:Uncharacterized protein n=1 Tax=Puccinia sorghi TaxID=27349 RepID=A0A0L6UZL6_9BASI|nr:hypothetical protein VP01_3278g1 [Puccinia sorghi]